MPTPATSLARTTIAPATGPPRPDILPGALGALAEKLPDGSCLAVREGGRDLVAVRAEVGLLPASTMKLVLASAAIDRLGPARAASIAEMLQKSDRATADLLLAELGGIEALRGWVAATGLGSRGIVIDDGAGFARTDRLSCRFLAGVLDRAGPSSPLAKGLPVAAETGTLETKFVGSAAAGRLRAKTGSLIDVRSLAGFVTAASGRHFVFAVILNGTDAPTRADSIFADLGTLLATA